MKKMRKGFTLIELLVVIGVMGIMSSLAMVGGQEATNAARATNIADGLEKAATAMMMYYSDNADAINESGTTAADVITGANAYLKTKLAKTDATDKKGKYSVELSGTGADAKWYVTYTFLDADASLKPMIANRANRMKLYSATTTTESESTTTTYDTLYAAGENDTYPDVVYMLVR